MNGFHVSNIRSTDCGGPFINDFSNFPGDHVDQENDFHGDHVDREILIFMRP